MAASGPFIYFSTCDLRLAFVYAAGALVVDRFLVSWQFGSFFIFSHALHLSVGEGWLVRFMERIRGKALPALRWRHLESWIGVAMAHF
jgi:hypothetical protein